MHYCIIDKNNVIHSVGCQYLEKNPIVIAGRKNISEIFDRNIKIHACIKPHRLSDDLMYHIKKNEMVYTGLYNNQLLCTLDALINQNPKWANTKLCESIACKFHKEISDNDKIESIINTLKCKLPKNSNVYYDDMTYMFIISHGFEKWALDIDIDSYNISTNKFHIKLYHSNKNKTRQGFDYHTQFCRNCTLNDIISYIYGHHRYFTKEFKMGPAYHIARKK